MKRIATSLLGAAVLGAIAVACSQSDPGTAATGTGASTGKGGSVGSSAGGSSSSTSAAKNGGTTSNSSSSTGQGGSSNSQSSSSNDQGGSSSERGGSSAAKGGSLSSQSTSQIAGGRSSQAGSGTNSTAGGTSAVAGSGAKPGGATGSGGTTVSGGGKTNGGTSAGGNGAAGGKTGSGGTVASGGSSTAPTVTACSFPSAWTISNPTYTTYSLPNPATACGYKGSNNTIKNIVNGANFAAIPGNTSQDFNTRDRCGACIQIGSAVITIVDECPNDSNQPCKNNPGGHLDLSNAAANSGGVKGDPALTNQTKWKYVPCPVTGNVIVRLKQGNNNEFYIENVVLPIASVVCGSQNASRTYYGAWHCSDNIDGESCTATDVAGRSITFKVGTTQDQDVDTGIQFPKCQ
jgi:hypothetical protein